MPDSPVRESAPARGDPARFAVLASGLAGRRVDLRWGDAGPAHTDGRTIFLPPREEGSEEGSEESGEDAGAADEVTRRRVVVHACLIGGGSLDPEVLGRLSGRPKAGRAGQSTVCARYFALEARRVLAARARSLPGLPLSSWWDGDPPPVTADAEESLRRAQGRDPIPAAPAAWGTIRPGAVLRRRDMEASSDLARGERAGGGQAGEHRADGDPSGKEHDPVFKNPLARFLRSMGDAFRAGSEGGQGEGAPSLESVGSRRPPGGSARSVRPEDLPPAPAPTEPGRVLYPEWDCDRGRYRPRWCGVVEVEPPPPAAATPPIHASDRRFERSLARLSLGVLRCRGERSGDDLWLDGMIRSRVARRTGDAPYDAVYLGNRWRRRDLAVLVLIDISGSVADETSDGTSVHRRQVDLARLLVGSMEVLGDRVAAYGFHSEGRTNVQLARIKRFDDRFDARAQQRLHALHPAAFTRLGAGIRHATRLLHEGAGTPWRLLVVLSDGIPYDDGYEANYAEADTRRAIAEARHSGAGCLCVTLGPHNETLQRVFGTATYAASDDPAAARTELVRLIRPALAAAGRTARSRPA